jgi:hypothetical protein
VGEEHRYPVPKADPNSQKELKGKLAVAIKAQKIAAKQFKGVVKDIPSGLPHPDGSDRIRNASRELTDANNRVVALLVELNRIYQDGDGKKRKP